MKRCIPCIVVAGTHSGVGKTSVTTALMSACVRRGKGDEFIDGYCTGNVIAGYFHVHFGSCPEFVKAFVAAANTANPL